MSAEVPGRFKRAEPGDAELGALLDLHPEGNSDNYPYRDLPPYPRWIELFIVRRARESQRDRRRRRIAGRTEQ